MKKYNHEFQFTNGDILKYKVDFPVNLNHQWVNMGERKDFDNKDQINLNTVDRIVTTVVYEEED